MPCPYLQLPSKGQGQALPLLAPYSVKSLKNLTLRCRRRGPQKILRLSGVLILPLEHGLKTSRGTACGAPTVAVNPKISAFPAIATGSLTLIKMILKKLFWYKIKTSQPNWRNKMKKLSLVVFFAVVLSFASLYFTQPEVDNCFNYHKAGDYQRAIEAGKKAVALYPPYVII